MAICIDRRLRLTKEVEDLNKEIPHLQGVIKALNPKKVVVTMHDVRAEEAAKIAIASVPPELTTESEVEEAPDEETQFLRMAEKKGLK